MPSLLLITWKNGRPVKTYGVNQVKIYNMKFTFICSVIVISCSVSASGDLEIYPGLKFNLNSEERRSRLENYDDTNFYNDYKPYPWKNSPENDYGEIERKGLPEYELTLPERLRQFEEVIDWEKAQLTRHSNHHVQHEKSRLPYEMRENTYSNLRDFSKLNDFKNIDSIYAPILQDFYNPEEDFTFKNEDNDIENNIQKPYGSILDDDGRFQTDKHSSLHKIRASEENSMTGPHHEEHAHQLTREEQFPSGTYKNVKVADDPSEFAYAPPDPRFYENAGTGSKMDVSAGKNTNTLDVDTTTNGKLNLKARSDKKLRDDEEGLRDNFHFKALNSEDTSRNGVADIVAVKSNISDVNSAGVYIIAIVAGISAAATVGLIAVGIGWYNSSTENNSGQSDCNLQYKSNSNLETTSTTQFKKFDPCSARNILQMKRYSSRDNLNRLAQPKRHYGSAQNLNQNNYVSMAEAVRRFQVDTPTRRAARKANLTIPMTPALLTQGRNRPVKAISYEEQEKLEYEEAQRYKIKAHPVNKKMLQGPLKPIPIEKKPVTVPEPFKITASHKVVESPKKKVHEFHARPVPKGVYEAPKLKNVQKLTKPITPTFMKNYVKNSLKLNECQEKQLKKDLNHLSRPSQTKPVPFSFALRDLSRPSQTKPVPFSFALRDQYCRMRKEEKIKNVYEEEKKAREFHARPIPKAVLNTAKSSSLCRSGSSNSIQTNGPTNSDENLHLSTQFRARPTTVLYKKPFEPKREERHLVEITEFQLNTEKRAKERSEFEKLKKKKKEKVELAKRMEEELQLKMEEEKIVQIRREAEYKAHPIKKYKEFKIEPSGKVTVPVSPKFHTDKYRTKENKENTK